MREILAPAAAASRRDPRRTGTVTLLAPYRARGASYKSVHVGEHVMMREFVFVNATAYNRLSFIRCAARARATLAAAGPGLAENDS